MPYVPQASPWTFTREPEAKSDEIEPAHYDFGEARVIDLTENLSFCRGNVVKYVCRAGRKTTASELTDLQKALWYLQREIARIESAGNSRDRR